MTKPSASVLDFSFFLIFPFLAFLHPGSAQQTPFWSSLQHSLLSLSGMIASNPTSLGNIRITSAGVNVPPSSMCQVKWHRVPFVCLWHAMSPHWWWPLLPCSTLVLSWDWSTTKNPACDSLVPLRRWVISQKNGQNLLTLSVNAISPFPVSHPNDLWPGLYHFLAPLPPFIFHALVKIFFQCDLRSYHFLAYNPWVFLIYWHME